MLGWDFVVAGSRVDLSDLDQHRYGDDNVDDDSGGDIYIMMKCLFVCLYRKIITSFIEGLSACLSMCLSSLP